MTAQTGAARIFAALAAVLAVLLGVVASQLTMAGDADATRATTEAAAAEPAAAEGGIHRVEVRLSEFALTPDEISVPSGVEVELVVVNDGALPHDVDVAGVGATALLDAGATETLALGVLDDGVYDLVCTVQGHDISGMTGTLTVGGAVADADDHGEHDETPLTPEEMAQMHDDVVAAFPADTEGRGLQPLEPVMDGEVKVFELTAGPVEWETEPGTVIEAMAYNGQIPGPRIDVDLGDRVRIELTNELEVPTALHLHGLELPVAMDGVPGLTQDSILPGETFTYELTTRTAGSHMYHSHFDAARQVPGGLLGAFVVHPPEDIESDVDHVMVLNDGPLGYTINGKGFPATEPLVVTEGETVRVRYMNEGLEVHPMHLHGIPQTVVAIDGHTLDAPYVADNVLVAPGSRIDVLVEAVELGPWAWHCHILTHAEAAHGMFGMVTALIVEEGEATDDPADVEDADETEDA